MSDLTVVDIRIHGEAISIMSANPDDVKALADELNNMLNALVNQYPTASSKPLKIMALACLKTLEENKKLKLQNDELSLQRDKLNDSLQAFFYNID